MEDNVRKVVRGVMKPYSALVWNVVILAFCSAGCDQITEFIKIKHEESKENLAGKTKNLELITKYAECKLSAKTAKEVDECETFRPVGSPKRPSAREQLEECVNFEIRFLDAMDVDKKIKWNDLKPTISKFCEQSITLSGNVHGDPDFQELKKAASANYIFRSLLSDNSKIIQDLKNEISMGDVYVQLATGKKMYKEFEASIAKGIRQGSIIAMILSLNHELEQCGRARAKTCDKARRAIETLKKRRFDGIDEYWAGYYNAIGNKSLAVEHASAYSESGDYDFINFFVDQRAMDYKRPLTLKWAKRHLAKFHLRGRVSAFLQHCAEKMITVPWISSESQVDVSGSTPVEWRSKVTAWADPDSNEFHPDLFLRFACEKVNEPGVREKAFRDYQNDIKKVFAKGFHFCSYFTDLAYSGACK